MTSSPALTPAARRAIASASVPLPTPTAWRAPVAAANALSKLSSSGPRMNQPRSMTRAIAAAIAARSGPGVSCRNGITVLRLDAVLDVGVQVLAVEGKRPPEPLFEPDCRHPAGGVAELLRIGIEAADVDAFLVSRPFHELHRSAAGNTDEELHQIPMADRRIAPDVEDIAVTGICRPARRKASAASST